MDALCCEVELLLGSVLLWVGDCERYTRRGWQMWVVISAAAVVVALAVGLFTLISQWKD